MAYEYLDQLGLTDDEKSKLRVLGAATPAALLSRIQYSPDARRKFADYIGSEARLEAIESALGGMTETSAQEPLPAFKPALGALDPGQLEGGENAQAQRDELVRQIQELRRTGATEAAEEKANQLRDLLKRA